jgi:hypothetical protein
MEPTNEVISGRSDTVDLEAVNRSLSTAVSELMAELSKADAEVERLRAALRECLSWHDYSNDMHKPIEVRATYMRARAALEGKSDE